MRILCVDPGEKRIGLAISDPTGTLARPLKVIKHQQRQADADTIAQLAVEHQVVKILVGMATGEDGKPNFSGRKALRLAAAIRSRCEIEVEMVDETDSTKQAVISRKHRGLSLPASHGHHDDEAAAVTLQYYLDTLPPNHPGPEDE
ncbi:MAG: Holliday junction resolvase RuvX [Anaerolineales bacterium]|nr:Holliday junction resolvase RuvX [Anaerolineales bacterium]